MFNLGLLSQHQAIIIGVCCLLGVLLGLFLGFVLAFNRAINKMNKTLELVDGKEVKFNKKKGKKNTETVMAASAYIGENTEDEEIIDEKPQLESFGNEDDRKIYNNAYNYLQDRKMELDKNNR